MHLCVYRFLRICVRFYFSFSFILSSFQLINSWFWTKTILLSAGIWTMNEARSFNEVHLTRLLHVRCVNVNMKPSNGSDIGTHSDYCYYYVDVVSSFVLFLLLFFFSSFSFGLWPFSVVVVIGLVLTSNNGSLLVAVLHRNATVYKWIR